MVDVKKGGIKYKEGDRISLPTMDPDISEYKAYIVAWFKVIMMVQACYENSLYILQGQLETTCLVYKTKRSVSVNGKCISKFENILSELLYQLLLIKATSDILSIRAEKSGHVYKNQQFDISNLIIIVKIHQCLCKSSPNLFLFLFAA